METEKTICLHLLSGFTASCVRHPSGYIEHSWIQTPRANGFRRTDSLEKFTTWMPGLAEHIRCRLRTSPRARVIPLEESTLNSCHMNASATRTDLTTRTCLVKCRLQ